MDYKYIVSSEWLKERLHDPDIYIADCRFQLGSPNKGIESYKEEHLPKAVHFDLEQELSGEKQRHGGRHPLPTMENFVHTLRQKGISNEKKVVIYDDQGGAMASRLWWMLRYVGHVQVFILNEGFSHWKEKGYPTTNKAISPQLAAFTPRLRKEMKIEGETLKKKLHSKEILLMDSRSKERYTGEQETIDPIAGHIPSAVNEDWQNRLSNDGRWLSKLEQDERLSKYIVMKDKELIVYCGSGVTACVNVLALEEMGLQPKLYVGSWSDWISYPDHPIATGEE
ncbi:MAG: sulfurtransferase [Bacillus sp. (in: Bacteria)]|nr:sulfurtransferase [Bacillus sp. (in: firmicutes)]